MKKPLKDDASPLAKGIYNRMNALGLNPRSASMAAGLNETYVRDVLRGRSQNQKSAEILKLAEALGCESVADLISYATARPPTIKYVMELLEEEKSLILAWRKMSRAQRNAIVVLATSAIIDSESGTNAA